MLLGFVGEAQADYVTGARLSDRTLCTKVDWIERDVLDDYRTWIGVEGGDPCLLWRAVRATAKQRSLKAHGHFGGEPGLPDARTARLALLLFAALQDRPQAVLLVRDTDCDTRRQRGLTQARDDRAWPFRVVIGAAHTKRECWVLAGFDPLDSVEKDRLKTEREKLGFDPCTQAAELTAIHDYDKKSAKRVLSELTAGDAGRESACLEADLEILRSRGERTGLRAFLEELEERVLPLFH